MRYLVNLSTTLVVIDEKLEPIDFFEAALVGHRVYEDECVCPSDVHLQRVNNEITFLITMENSLINGV